MNFYRTQVLSVFPYFTKKMVETEEDRHLQRIAWALKDGRQVNFQGRRMPATEWLVDLVANDDRLHNPMFLGSHRLLVPIPCSTVTDLPPDPSRWTCLDFAYRLAMRGFGGSVAPAIVRSSAVQSSRAARSDGRDPPSVSEHLESLSLYAQFPENANITLIDDIVSAGRTATAAMLKLREAGCMGEISLFSACYTNYEPGRRGPYRGQIVWSSGRRPFRESV